MIEHESREQSQMKTAAVMTQLNNSIYVVIQTEEMLLEDLVFLGS